MSSVPRTPMFVSTLARCFMITLIVLVFQWVQQPLMKGLALRPVVVSEAVILTDGIFNWHPVLMTLAFVGFMGEAVLAYKAPLSFKPLSRSNSKTLHWLLHSSAAVCIVLGLIAVFKAHSLHKPVLADLWSPHSYLGMFTVSLAGLQYACGFAAYLWPKISLAQRVALGPLHRFLGLAVYTMGLSTIAVGLQEKASFMQFKGGAGLYTLTMRLPAIAELLVVFVGLTVLYHHAPQVGGGLTDDHKAVLPTPLDNTDAHIVEQYQPLTDAEDQR